MRRLLPFITFAAWLLVAGCGGNVSVRVDRQADTGTFAGEQIVVLLVRYRLEANQVKDLGSTEERFERCIRREMQEVKDDLAFLPPATLRKLVSADITAAFIAYDAHNGTQSPDSLLRLLADPVTKTRLAEAKVRYVVLLEATYSTSRGRFETGGAGSAPGGAWVWNQYSSLQATILDLKHARITGSVASSSIGEEGAGLILVIPLYFTSMAESGACAALGKELARFISGTSTP